MKTLIIFGLLFPLSLISQFDININQKTYGSDDLKIQNNCQISFQDENSYDLMFVKKKDGTVDEFKLSELSRIIFEKITSVDEYIPSILKLENYPNPFEQKTTIAFTIEKSNNVDLTIYDMNGNIVKTLLSGVIEQGEYKIDWDGYNSDNLFVSSGIYFYQLKFDNEIITKKLIMIK